MPVPINGLSLSFANNYQPRKKGRDPAVLQLLTLCVRKNSLCYAPGGGTRGRHRAWGILMRRVAALPGLGDARHWASKAARLSRRFTARGLAKGSVRAGGSVATVAAGLPIAAIATATPAGAAANLFSCASGTVYTLQRGTNSSTSSPGTIYSLSGTAGATATTFAAVPSGGVSEHPRINEVARRGRLGS